MIASADHVVDLGPGAGTAGGEVVFEQPPGATREGPWTTKNQLRFGGSSGKRSKTKGSVRPTHSNQVGRLKY
jgi:excinuclease UvrABC ATPase subunit